MKKEYTEEELQVQLEQNSLKAETILKDKSKMDKFLVDLEIKLKNIPNIGEVLADIPVMVSMVKAYITKEYTEMPAASMVAVISALIYFVSSIDLIPDFIPVVGFADDAAMIAFVVKMVSHDLAEFKKWREQQ